MDRSISHEDGNERSSSAPDTPILFFDGECVVCNGFVDLVLSLERTETVQFAPIQGETANAHLSDLPDSREEWALFLLDEDGFHEASEAALRLFEHIGGVWRFMGLFRCIPVSLRDTIYRWIARNRYRLFGRKDACRVPSPDEMDRFLP